MLSNKEFEIGIDEVGRGPLAGPVTVAGVLIPRGFDFEDINYKGKLLNLRDSKKHTPEQREFLLEQFKEMNISFIFSSVYPKVIDKINISKATNVAAERVVKSLISLNNLLESQVSILTDGGIKIGDGNKVEYRSIVKGDEKITSIKMASIVAKVKRDSAMKRYGKIFPEYNFPKHKGYGTKEHMKLIEKHGPCRIHRLTFI